MNIKKSTVDTINIMFIMLSTISPYFIAKFLVFLSLFFLFIRIFLSRDLFLYTNKKILIIIFLLPGIIGVIFIAPENLIRFAGIILIILGFPFSSFKVKSFPILILSYLILLYLIITQILIMQGNQLIIDFREFAYTDESSHLHRGPMYGPVENILDNAFSFEANIRAGGIYSNPNVLALIVLLFFFVLDVSSKNFNETIISNKKKLIRNFSYFLIFLLVTFCFMLAKSRTVIGAFSFYIIFKYIDWSILRRFKIKKKTLLPIFFSIGFLLFFLERILSALFAYEDSGRGKFNIFFNYLDVSSPFNLFFGGTFDVQFDSEYGYWLGSTGLSGFIAFYIFYKMIYKFSRESRALILSFLIISFGNTLFYSLLNIPIISVLFVMMLSYNKKNLIIN